MMPITTGDFPQGLRPAPTHGRKKAKPTNRRKKLKKAKRKKK